MNIKYRTWEETQVEHFQKHPEEIQHFVNFAFEEAEKAGDWGAFLDVLRTVAEAQGGLGKLAEKLGCSRTTLYRTLSRRGNPRLGTLSAILRVLGLQLAVQPVHKAVTKKRAKAQPKITRAAPRQPRATAQVSPARAPRG